jgi:hypothetical protein
VAGQVVHDDDGAWRQVGDENLLDIDFEGIAIDRSIEDPGGDDAAGEEPSTCLPASSPGRLFESSHS